VHGQPTGLEPDDDGAIAIGPKHTRASRGKPLERGPCRVAIRIAGPGRRDRHPGSDGIDERLGRRGPTAVVGHLEKVDAGKTGCEQLGVDRLLHVAHEQEPSGADPPVEDHRHVVDAGPAVRRILRHAATDRPQHAHFDLINREPIAGSDRATLRMVVMRQLRQPRLVTGARAAHARLQHARHVVSPQQQRQACHVVLVRVRQDDRVDPPVPGRDPSIQRDQQAIGVRAAVDQQPAAARALDKDRVTLADVEDGDPGRARRSRNGHAPDDGGGKDEGDDQRALDRARLIRPTGSAGALIESGWGA
jgi:hypothetical protein